MADAKGREEKRLVIKDDDIITITPGKSVDGKDNWKINIRDKLTKKDSKETMGLEDVLVLASDPDSVNKGKNVQLGITVASKADAPRPVLRNDSDNIVRAEGAFTIAAGNKEFQVPKNLHDLTGVVGSGKQFKLPAVEKILTRDGDVQTLTMKASNTRNDSANRPTEIISLEKGAKINIELAEATSRANVQGPTLQFIGGDTDASLTENRTKLEYVHKYQTESIIKGGGNVTVEGAKERGFEPAKEPMKDPMAAPMQEAAVEEKHPVKKLAKETLAALETITTNDKLPYKEYLNQERVESITLKRELKEVRDIAEKIAKSGEYKSELTGKFAKQLSEASASFAKQAALEDTGKGADAPRSLAHKFVEFFDKTKAAVTPAIVENNKMESANKPAPEKPVVDEKAKATAVTAVEKAGQQAAADIKNLMTEAPPKGRKGFFDNGTIPTLGKKLEAARDAATKLGKDSDDGKGRDIDKKQMDIFKAHMREADELLGKYKAGPGVNIARENVRPVVQKAADIVEQAERAYGAVISQQKELDGTGKGHMMPDGKNVPEAVPGAEYAPVNLDHKTIKPLAEQIVKQVDGILKTKLYSETGPGKNAREHLLELQKNAKNVADNNVTAGKGMANFETSLNTAIRAAEQVHIGTKGDDNKEALKILRAIGKNRTNLDKILGKAPAANKQGSLEKPDLDTMLAGIGDELRKVGFGNQQEAGYKADKAPAATQVAQRNGKDGPIPS